MGTRKPMTSSPIQGASWNGAKAAIMTSLMGHTRVSKLAPAKMKGQSPTSTTTSAPASMGVMPRIGSMRWTGRRLPHTATAVVPTLATRRVMLKKATLGTAPPKTAPPSVTSIPANNNKKKYVPTMSAAPAPPTAPGDLGDGACFSHSPAKVLDSDLFLAFPEFQRQPGSTVRTSEFIQSACPHPRLSSNESTGRGPALASAMAGGSLSGLTDRSQEKPVGVRFF